MKRFAFLVFWLAVNCCWYSKATSAEDWVNLVTSGNYSNTKLIVEDSGQSTRRYSKKESSISTVRVYCSKMCASNANCQAFNFYPTATQYVCEFLRWNFCSRRHKIALMHKNGGTVYDKLHPRMTMACIDQVLANTTANMYCEVGRSGCQYTWPHCDICVKSCSECKTAYNRSGRFDCTLWPEGVSEVPIFALCDNTATILATRNVNVNSGEVRSSYRMPLSNMNRLCKLAVYKRLILSFTTTQHDVYTTTFRDFFIESSGTLSNLTFNSSSSVVGSEIMRLQAPNHFPWITTSSSNKCGSFWMLKGTYNTSTIACPGGAVGMFGHVNVSLSPKWTGIHWPQATAKKQICVFADVKLDT